MLDYFFLAVVAGILIGGGLFLLRAARQRRARRRRDVDELLQFQASQIATGAGDGVDLKALIEQGRS